MKNRITNTMFYLSSVAASVVVTLVVTGFFGGTAVPQNLASESSAVAGTVAATADTDALDRAIVESEDGEGISLAYSKKTKAAGGSSARTVKLNKHQKSMLKYAQSLAKPYGEKVAHKETACSVPGARVLGCYSPSGGSVRISLTRAGLSKSKAVLKSIVLHEISHGIIMWACHDNPIPKIVGKRIEYVTSAYAVILGAKKKHLPSTVYNKKDMSIAKKIRADKCF